MKTNEYGREAQRRINDATMHLSPSNYYGLKVTAPKLPGLDRLHTELDRFLPGSETQVTSFPERTRQFDNMYTSRI
ncbi:hypothetical protein PACILC2_49620 [Paenibacillus cisolokensis]|uniref:Uncharacterized protein n=1 Tax=Paenibacillus cisolokensis TaxID=1658519 RepID=A0ABQ4NEM1_9BACL|nr:hypothetical protein [Paenibacillus cisolokensis]GIQ66394.1 hypothetical protein PACILC2_49620 [Paenibacillus cisolokensis]